LDLAYLILVNIIF